MSATPKRPEEPAEEPPAPEQIEGYSPEEEEEVQKRLEDLGYI
jgi:hypothetical protein